ncbi:DUF711 family protein [Chroococcidiopsis sp. CCMEE 29]|uniref:DUF711 family protein n=1 Tax=Chroococcidiopsis sp. CCMEE 29 TaxID=155894 RepID=UPI0020203867|nr:DUF711 family protein [Chroococcidiopsis sp. CCMEE 29]
MKIRTITTGISLTSLKQQERIIQAAQFNQTAKDFLEQQGYKVQTNRIATNSWEEYLHDFSTAEIIGEIKVIDQFCQNLNVNFFSIGYASSPERIAIIPEIIKNSSIVYCSSRIGDSETGINFANVSESAKVIKRIAEETADGYGNFRFCAWANCKPGIPFFPVSYHEGEPAFAIGLECSDLVTKAFKNSNSLQTAEEKLKLAFEEELTKVEAIAQQISDKFGIKYSGIDSSLAPSLDRETSIAFAYEKLGFGKFGHQGTLTISAIITRILKSLSIKTCGYSGLMLPVCEDVGLAQRANEQTYNLTNLLLYSAVCGCGLDTVPIPGDVTIEKLEAILLDLATLAIKLDKPLSARLFPIPGKKAGEMTAFKSPYLVDCQIFKV